MSSDYSKMKNAELEALLKSRNLPHHGKKAEMVDRLLKDDEKTTGPTTDNAEDEIDWEDDAIEPSKAAAEIATSEPAAAAIKAGGQGQVANPQAVPNQVADIDPSNTSDLAVKPPTEDKDIANDVANGTTSENAKSEEPAVDFSRGLAATSLDEEIEKRKARAKKFGTNIEDDEGFKKLERMKKFGETAAPKGLDEALPERAAGRKRGRDGDDDSGRNKRRGGKFGGRRGRGPKDGDRRSPRENRREQGGRPKGNDNWMSEADKARAEARKNRFAAAPAAST